DHSPRSVRASSALSMRRLPRRSTLFPYTTLFRSIHLAAMDQDPGFVEQAVKDSVPRLFSALARDHVAAIHRGYREGDPAASRRLYDYITWAGWLQWLDGLPPGATKRRAGESD